MAGKGDLPVYAMQPFFFFALSGWERLILCHHPGFFNEGILEVNRDTFIILLQTIANAQNQSLY